MKIVKTTLKSIIATSSLLVALSSPVLAQEVSEEETSSEETPLVISGSVDTYYRYETGKGKNSGDGFTSFAGDHNSMSIGMVDIALEKSFGKASFVGEVSFGPRSSESIPGNGYYNIQNLYASYALTDQLSITGGYMGTFVGYEVISPAGNYNYSTSYLFTNGPFQNAGVKLDYAITDGLGVMVGAFNSSAGPWNSYVADTLYGLNDIGGQIYFGMVEGLDAYVNVISGPQSGTEIDLTATYAISDAFNLGLNVADYSTPVAENGGFQGAALYAQYAFSDAASLGLRYENFTAKEGKIDGVKVKDAQNVSAFTLSGNITEGGFRFIPEVRYDLGDKEYFANGDGSPSTSFFQFIFAAVYAF